MAGADKAAKDAKEAPKEAAEGAVAAPPSAVKKLLPFIVGGTLSIGLGVTAGIVTKPEDPPAEVTQKAPEPEPTPLDQLLPAHSIAMPTLIVNLADTSAAVSSKMNLVIKVRVKDEPTQTTLDGDCAKGGVLAVPMRDALITLLSGKQSTDLKTPRGKEQLKLEILDKLKPILFPDPSVGVLTDIYFDEFLVQ